jgi:Protein of unknown function (DUF2997)
MNGQTIEITVSPTGETTVQTKGFTGSSCRDASKFIEQALGDKTAETLRGCKEIKRIIGRSSDIGDDDRCRGHSQEVSISQGGA